MGQLTNISFRDKLVHDHLGKRVITETQLARIVNIGDGPFSPVSDRVIRTRRKVNDAFDRRSRLSIQNHTSLYRTMTNASAGREVPLTIRTGYGYASCPSARTWAP